MSLAGLVVAVNALAAEPDLAQARQWLQTGRYEECKAEARRALAKTDTDEARLLLVRALLATGRYPEAVVVATNGLDPWLYVYAVGGAGLVWLFHWDNIGRLLRGQERKIGTPRPEG